MNQDLKRGHTHVTRFRGGGSRKVLREGRHSYYVDTVGRKGKREREKRTLRTASANGNLSLAMASVEHITAAAPPGWSERVLGVGDTSRGVRLTHVTAHEFHVLRREEILSICSTKV